ncbi:hypothetical protein B0A52_07303 [Exophiala mesophila]|uniref:DNA/RNA-binding domain-containing protein n=1 Tax=Exophiala mesophila TaxID=212818 RepID=A0A438MZ72_EXOME|nr:hypothetical protein B0A52_07303 [Exophiala mesophila]
MEEPARKALRHVQRLENDLSHNLSRKDPVYPSFEPKLAELRSACQDFIFLDITQAGSQRIEVRLWDLHAKVNQKFKPFLAQFKDEQGKKRHVERRKAEKLYLDFLKSSQRFYRGYIQRLASHFKDIPEVLQVAKKFNLDTLTADPLVQVDDSLKKHIVHSCYLSLVQLGDLSRYRESEIPKKTPDWGPAKGYYELAIALDPTWGTSYNQLAVIALKDQDHLRAVYYLYRSISVENPFPQAPNNLELEFKKIRARALQGKPISPNNTETDGTLCDLFLVFHASCADITFVSDEVQVDEMLRRLGDHLKEQPSDSNTRKLCLINIAAEEVVAQKIRAGSTEIQPFRNLQQLNVGTFFLLLRLFLAELRAIRPAEKSSSSSPQSVEFTALMRRILPHLRLYSSWLLSTTELLMARTELQLQMRKFWHVYAETLSMLVAIFPIIDIVEVPYLLMEDADTIGFSPFIDLVRKQHMFNSKDMLKPVYDEETFGPRSVDDEMLSRVKSLVKDGILLCRHQEQFGSISVPLQFAGNRFVALDIEPIQDVHPVPVHDLHSRSIHGVNPDNVDLGRVKPRLSQDVPPQADNVSEAGVTESATSTMENMVNDLTHPEPAQRAGFRSMAPDQPLTPTLKTPTASSFSDRVLPHLQGSSFTARDLSAELA